MKKPVFFLAVLENNESFSCTAFGVCLCSAATATSCQIPYIVVDRISSAPPQLVGLSPTHDHRVRVPGLLGPVRSDVWIH